MKYSSAFLILLSLLPALTLAEKIAITFDDLPLNGTLPQGVTEADIVRRVLPLFEQRRLPPMMGFINARQLESNPSGAEALKLWVAGGQRVGNHTYSHVDLSRTTAADFIRDIAQNEPALLLLSDAQDWRWLRYPYLHEGDTMPKREAVRKWLREHEYAVAQTTLDYEDYLWNSAYARCVDKHDTKAIEWLHASYLATADAYLEGNRIMARTVFGREISHVLLLHLGAFSPEILPALFALLEKRGFEPVTLEEAQRDAAYRTDPAFVAKKTGTLLEQHMDARRLPYPTLPPKPADRLTTICM